MSREAQCICGAGPCESLKSPTGHTQSLYINLTLHAGRHSRTFCIFKTFMTHSLSGNLSWL